MIQQPEQLSLEALPDDHLLTLAKEGNAEAVSALAQRYVPLLRRAVASCSSDTRQRDDLEQEGFIALLSAIHTYQPARTGAAFSTYAYACVRNRVISALRRIRVRENREELPEGAEEEPAAGSEADPALLVQQREEQGRLAALLRQELSELEYHVLRLHLQELSYEEIGARLAVPAKTVDNALQRVRRKLASRLREEMV